MAAHNQIGKDGEALAKGYFEERGYRILHQNWRFKHWEVDIIASYNNILHFIEVKCLRGKNRGFPEQTVSKKKIQNLMNAAAAYTDLFPGEHKIRFDVLAITLQKNIPAEYFLIEDVYDY